MSDILISLFPGITTSLPEKSIKKSSKKKSVLFMIKCTNVPMMLHSDEETI